MNERYPVTAVILGNSHSIFTQQLARYWITRGIDTTIVTKTNYEPKDISTVFVRPPQDRLSRWYFRIARRCDQFIEWLYKGRGHRIMGSNWKPDLVTHALYNIHMAKVVRSMKPDFVFGQEVFSYGLATALCKGYPRIIFPWGNDIYRYAHTNPIAFAITKFALRKTELVCPTSAIAAEYIRTTFRISSEKVKSISWGVKDGDIFVHASPKQRENICREYDINPNTIIVMNIRRFHPDWGANIALDAFLEIAKTEKNKYHFVFLGNSGAEDYIRNAQERVIEDGVQEQFTIIHGEIPLSECARLMSISDIFTSLMIVPDMRSSSILQAAKAGAVPILSDQQEYHVMERWGFQAHIVDVKDIDSIVFAIKHYGETPQRRQTIIAQNQNYIDKYENYEIQMEELLKEIKDIISNSK